MVGYKEKLKSDDINIGSIFVKYQTVNAEGLKQLH